MPISGSSRRSAIVWLALVLGSCGDDTSIGTASGTGTGTTTTETSGASTPVDTSATSSNPDTSGTADASVDSSAGPDTSDSSAGSTTVGDCEGDCDDENPCTVDSCVAGSCANEPVDGPPPRERQTSGDCLSQVCSAGELVPEIDDADLPVDDNPCTADVCTDGNPSNPAERPGTSCNRDGVCDGAGACSECISPDDCDQLAPDDDCRTRTCEGGVCGETFAPAGTDLTLQTAGDCRREECDGAGDSDSIVDDLDLPDDGLECTEDVCTAGTPSNPPLPVDTSCRAGVCDGAGGCQGCNTPDDCEGTDTFCQTITCEGGVCGVDNAPLGMLLPAADQSAGDCQVRQCDGAGTAQSIADDFDVPTDDGNDCTDETCEAGIPDHPDLPVDTECNDGGGLFCDGAGTCVECNADEQCSEADQCDVPACIANVCDTQPEPAGTACDDQLFCTFSDTCNGNGTCVGDGDPCPGPDGDSNCAEACNEAADNCTGNDPNGATCDDGLFCTSQDVCNGSGTCNGGGDPCPGPDGDGDCSESCNESADSCTGNDANGTSCDDGAFCTATDTCSAGSCTGSGAPCPGADGDGDCSESCNEAADDCSGLDGAGTSCNDGLFCTATDACDAAGACIGAGAACAGPDGDNDCSETCNEAADNCNGNDLSGTACDDGLFCTQTDQCNGNGACGGAGNPCPGVDNDADCSEFCDEAANDCNGNDPGGSACDDGVFCNGVDVCNAGACNGAGNPCPGADGDSDCSETCDEAAENCSGLDPAGATCNDGLFCTATDACDAAGACIGAGTACAGPDGDNDCSETCNEAADNCNGNDLSGTACDDGLFCTQTDQCNGNGACGGAGNPCPGVDNDADCSEFCDEAANDCNGNDPGGSACNDGVFCNGVDVCNAGACTGAGNPCPGADGDGDCSETCNEAGDDCNGNDANGAACSDGLFCTSTDACNGSGVCAGTGNPCPGADGDIDCSEMCNEAGDACDGNDPNNSVCNDGLFCTTTDRCNAGGACIGIGNPCAGADGDFDCSETCNENTNNCTGNDPNGSACTDGLFCNGLDTCNAGSCNVHVGSPCPGADGDLDCSETCSEAADNCNGNDPVGSACNDGAFCTATDTCNNLGACTGSGNPCPGPDGDFDCSETCDEGANNCNGNDALNSACNDGLFCTQTDRCNGAGACGGTGNPCPGSDNDCDCSEQCNEGADNCSTNDPNGVPCGGNTGICGNGVCAALGC